MKSIWILFMEFNRLNSFHPTLSYTHGNFFVEFMSIRYSMLPMKMPYFHKKQHKSMAISLYLRIQQQQQKKMVTLLQPKCNYQPTNFPFTTNANRSAVQEAHDNPNLAETVRKLCKQSRLAEALRFLHVFDRTGIRVDSSMYDSLLWVCLETKALRESKLVHAHVIQTGFKLDLALGTKLVITYAKCGSRIDARLVLGEIPERKVVSWSAMIAAYAKHGFPEEALMLFNEMQQADIEADERTFASVLPVCAKLEALQQGKEIHEYIIRNGFHSNIFLGNALLDMYVKCDCVQDACKVLGKMPERDVVSWNAMIAGYARNGEVYEALEVFQKMPQRNVVSWTAMISAYAIHGYGEEAVALFYQMLQMCIHPNQFTYASVLPACANLVALEHGKEIHEDIIKSGFQSDIFVGNALVDMYSKCGQAHNALKVFDKMPKRDVVSWTAMITGYVQNGLVDKALDLFQRMPERNLFSWNAMIAGYAHNGPFNVALKLFCQMQLTSVKPSLVTLASVLSACANMVALREGKEIHEDIIRNGYMSDVFVGSSLIDMYAKCGSIDAACKVFNRMPRQDTISWTAMIIGYAMHGSGKDALHLFEQMQHSGTKPDHVTFLGVLSACCHSGLVVDGWQYFNCMSEDYHMAPAVEHYCCMVDLLGRAGHLYEARDFINKMPITPDAAVWASLLGACRIHSNTMLAEEVAQRLLETDPQNAAHYVLLSNIYAAVGRWDELKKVRTLMQDRGVIKMPGCSWIEVNNKVHTFVVGDKSHPQTEIIYAKLETLYGQIKELGYIPDMNFVLHDVEEEQKEDMLYYHSEKLAIAFGLINITLGMPIRIVKNLRVCGDCHSASKFISKIVSSEIVVRDANRFHHFKDGLCSCGDYW